MNAVAIGMSVEPLPDDPDSEQFLRRRGELRGPRRQELCAVVEGRVAERRLG